MKFSAYEDIVHLTQTWTGERMPDGRPRVSDDILRRMRDITLEEAWGPLWKAGYKFQFEGRLRASHPARKLVGRAVTAILVPQRPDLHTTLMEYGTREEGRRGTFNQWVIDSLVEDDVAVVDLFDKIYEGTYVGGNLSTAIQARTKQGGAVIWGGVRDLEQIVEIPDIQVYFRGNDPTGIGNVTMTGMNVPCRIGEAICMPGDIVLGTISGVLFIPPHLAETCVTGAEKSHLRDIFGFTRLEEKIYTTAQIDIAWTEAMWLDFLQWQKQDARAEKYAHLTWDEELEEARKRAGEDGRPPQVRL